MALTKCSECGHEISTKADKCPTCGAPQRAKTSRGLKLFLLLIVVGVVASFFGREPTTSKEPPVAAAAPKKPAWDKSDAAQRKREKNIATMRQNGVVSKVECRSQGGEVWVSPGFAAFSLDNKAALLMTPYMYCFDGTNPLVGMNVIDDRTGKKIGRFTPASTPALDLD
jgi:hypothetical protein